ncbi:glycosyltransferase [Lacinutrix sp. C3R15]|uniref:glycosyltransferase n=1 Tax=Flavobacteriaceae TaxID=49546 RepID=UPI001C08C1BD|nr:MULTISPECIES: glycosyltransferase [Flavobacteriaceae]MBU2939564.1 glycosyltransferase [Lacinutrix sp. C3R15]MDO6622878.1 glycosyltransferase [Oceanihabitans sp. 1_MG-2023]
MKTVCFVVSSFPRVSETFVTNHVIQAKLQGYSVLLLVKKKLPITESSQKELIVKHDLLKDIYTTDYKIPSARLKRRLLALVYIIKYLKYWFQVKDVSFRKRFSSLPFQLAFYNLFKDVSVFHVQFATAGKELAKMKAIGLLKGDVITTFHGYDAHFNSDAALEVLKKRYQLLLEHSKYVTVNTPYLAKQVNAIMPASSLARVVVIPMGIDLDFFKPKYRKDLVGKTTFKLISVGRLIDFKGFTYAIKSVRKVIDMGFPVRYTIVGAGVLNDALQDLIVRLKLEAHVFLVGAKNQKEIKDLFEAHDVFLMSSVTDSTNRAETQGVVTAEAQAMGLPVVAFNSGGVPYTILEGKTGFLVAEKDVTAYAEAIVKLLESPDDYSAMSSAAKAFVLQNFSSTTLATQFFELYG